MPTFETGVLRSATAGAGHSGSTKRARLAPWPPRTCRRGVHFYSHRCQPRYSHRCRHRYSRHVFLRSVSLCRGHTGAQGGIRQTEAVQWQCTPDRGSSTAVRQGSSIPQGVPGVLAALGAHAWAAAAALGSVLPSWHSGGVGGTIHVPPQQPGRQRRPPEVRPLTPPG